ncbi:hypothetical protein WA026_002902 [Henosepilachna vigintioctopunctata]|uniref:Uncharacterized protein n=1 Tax=Henosepilachna vigintioctopunctata TaxID=420089 RepID=A0AAW1TI86_9CUCU
MSENDHPKVIVDDDFLDLRNPQSKTFSKRPISPRSKTRDSSSTNTREKLGSSREVLPGLQRLFSTYNQKNISNFRSKRPSDGKNVQIDTRFRRKVEKKALSTRSTSLLLERGKSVKERDDGSNTSEETESSVSSSENMVDKRQSVSVDKSLPQLTKQDSKEVNEEIKTIIPRENKTSLNLTGKLVDKHKPKSNQEKKRDNGDNSTGIKPLDGQNEKSLKRSSTPIKKANQEFADLPNAEQCMSGDYKSSSVEESSSATRGKKDKYESLIDDEKHKNEKLFDIEETSCKDEYTRPTSGGVIRDLLQDCRDISSKLQSLKWYDPTLLIPHSLHSIPSFRKSWTIPSFPLIKRDVFWGRHYNVLCEKEDRKTYKFDTDDTISLESMEKPSSHSSRFGSNYMNLIFCLGCMCGIFLVAGILTASEIQAKMHGPDDSKIALFELVFKELLYTFDAILNGFLHILTFPVSYQEKNHSF